MKTTTIFTILFLLLASCNNDGTESNHGNAPIDSKELAPSQQLTSPPRGSSGTSTFFTPNPMQEKPETKGASPCEKNENKQPKSNPERSNLDYLESG